MPLCPGRSTRVFEIGSAVTGGRHGEAPTLSRTDTAGNVTPTVDFRSVYASVLDEWLGVDADEILGTRHGRLSLVSPASV